MFFIYVGSRYDTQCSIAGTYKTAFFVVYVLVTFTKCRLTTGKREGLLRPSSRSSTLRNKQPASLNLVCFQTLLCPSRRAKRYERSPRHLPRPLSLAKSPSFFRNMTYFVTSGLVVDERPSELHSPETSFSGSNDLNEEFHTSQGFAADWLSNSPKFWLLYP